MTFQGGFQQKLRCFKISPMVKCCCDRGQRMHFDVVKVLLGFDGTLALVRKCVYLHILMVLALLLAITLKIKEGTL